MVLDPNAYPFESASRCRHISSVTDFHVQSDVASTHLFLRSMPFHLCTRMFVMYCRTAIAQCATWCTHATSYLCLKSPHAVMHNKSELERQYACELQFIYVSEQPLHEHPIQLKIARSPHLTLHVSFRWRHSYHAWAFLLYKILSHVHADIQAGEKRQTLLLDLVGKHVVNIWCNFVSGMCDSIDV